MTNVVAGIIIDGSRVLLARKAANKSRPGKWEFPGGKIENDESAESALERELFEELNILTQTGDHFFTTEFAYQDFDIRLISYYSKYISGSIHLSDHDKISWVEIQNLLSYDLAEADVEIARELIKKTAN